VKLISGRSAPIICGPNIAKSSSSVPSAHATATGRLMRGWFLSLSGAGEVWGVFGTGRRAQGKTWTSD